MEKARWSPDLKYNIYKKAVIHFRKHQYALASVVAQQRDDSHIMKLIQSKGENTRLYYIRGGWGGGVSAMIIDTK